MKILDSTKAGYTMNGEGDNKSISRYFEDSWKELETRFKNNEITPDQENDVVCFLYYALAKRLEKKRKKEAKNWYTFDTIRTEYDIGIDGQKHRVDLVLADRFFIEVKIRDLRKFGEENLERREP